MRATEMVLGDYVAWEPESIWEELGRQGIDVPIENHAKVMAGVALLLVPSFYWDAIVYEKTAIAFSGHVPSPDILEEASPAQLAWAVVEAGMILKTARAATWEFGHEPRAYTGVVLARAGFALVPDALHFAQKALDRERPADDFRDVVAAKWRQVDKTRLHTLSLGETREDVQVARLAAIELHVRERTTTAERELGALA